MEELDRHSGFTSTWPYSVRANSQSHPKSEKAKFFISVPVFFFFSRRAPRAARPTRGHLQATTRHDGTRERYSPPQKPWGTLRPARVSAGGAGPWLPPRGRASVARALRGGGPGASRVGMPAPCPAPARGRPRTGRWSFPARASPPTLPLAPPVPVESTVPHRRDTPAAMLPEQRLRGDGWAGGRVVVLPAGEDPSIRGEARVAPERLRARRGGGGGRGRG